jgi:hypothetical protein
MLQMIFYIDTSAILHLQYNDTHSYTFAIFRQGNSTRIENLVITEKINGEILAKIVSYNLTNPEKIAIQNNEFVNLSTKMSSTTVDPSTFSIQQLTTRIECHDEERQVVEACSSKEHDESNMELWHRCTATVKPKMYIILTTVCEYVSGGGGDNGGSIGLPGDSGAGSNTGGEPIGNIDDIIDNPITTPLLNVSPVIAFIWGLNTEQSQWWNEVATTETKELLENYLNQNTVDNVLLDEAEQFALQFIQNSLSSGLNLDFEKSLKSPANIDFSAIDTNTPEGQHFSWIYDKLMQTDDFKQLFINTFGGSQTRLNVKFEFADDLPSGQYGTCRLQLNNGNYTNLIRINRSKIGTTSNLSIAKTIFHEGIHAYLNIKNIDENLGSSIPALNGMDLKEVIGTFYQGFGGIPVNGSNQTQHAFIFDHLVPVLEHALADLKFELISQSDISVLDNTTNGYFYNNSTGLEEPFNWNDLFYFLSLNGLQESPPFITLYPVGSIGRAKFDWYGYYVGIINLTKTEF